MLNNETEREVVILMTDMVQYSQKSLGMTPDEIRDFLIDYHGRIHSLIYHEESLPLDIEPSAGDGSLVVFDKRPGESKSGTCSRALHAALRMARAIESGFLPPTRMGILLGPITEAKIGTRIGKFGTSFAVANRLEELCGHFGTILLMDREVARYQEGFDDYIVNVAKVTLTCVIHPMNIFTLYQPGIHNCPADVDEEKLFTFIRMKNEAMEYFSGNLLVGTVPDFPRVREELITAHKYFRELTGEHDLAIGRILEYIRETPVPPPNFDRQGMKLMEKKRDSLGDRLFHMSKQLLRALNPDFYHALVVDTDWEKYFKLEWCKKGDTIIEIDSIPDGIYYLDTGTAETYSREGKLLSTMDPGTIFGEMAYFGSERRRTATVLAQSDVVLRRISTDDFKNLPIIISIFEHIAIARQQQIVKESDGTDEEVTSSPP